MRSHAGGNLTAFLMFAVLSTVPLLAVFGIPEFVPASNSLSDQDVAFDEINFRSSPSPGINESDAFSLSAAPDIFASVQNASRDISQRHLSQADSHTEQIQNPFLQLNETDQIFGEQTKGIDRVSASEALAGWELSNTIIETPNGPQILRTETIQELLSSAGSDTPFSRNSASDLKIKSSEIRRSETGRNGLQNPPLTWRSAVRRLNELGIRQFRLEPGSREQEFHFSCFLTPKNNPRVTRRFEAEAADPLRAVEHVLQQITLWQQKR